MADRVLPTGTVTFLFSDMEGSTRLVRDLGPGVFAELLDRHNDILRGTFTRFGATERGTQGDSFFVMFPEAPAAVEAATAAQRELARAVWPGDVAVRVRMGLHTGIARLGGDDYVGLDVNRAARIAALAHGGQVLLSDATRALTANALPVGVSLRRLGAHRLRDAGGPEPLHQLVIDGLPADFPPLAAKDDVAGNLPSRLTTFVGREVELEAIEHLLDDTVLVTLTGPGGAGKTRLAVELARRGANRYEDGAWLVRLEGVDDPGLVLDTVATTFGLVESPGVSALDRLHGFLADRSLLLILDNFEHLLQSAPQISELLERGTGLRVIVTSRAPLHIGPEQEFPVHALAPSDAIELFVGRAQLADPTFLLTDANRDGITAVCARLDGLPLGIELAAARIGLLPPNILADQLTRRLDLPGAAPRDLPARQRTLAETIAWSYDLLDEPARRLLERLSVFNGGFRLAEVQVVSGPADELGADSLDALATLVDHSLLESLTGPDVPRFRMLETIQRFASERLASRGDTALTRERHARAYLALAEEAAGHMPSRDQLPWLDRLTVDHDNIRTALGWAMDRADAELAHRLLAACWRFWEFRGHVTEGRARAAEVLEMPGGDVTTAWRMRAMDAAGGLAWWASDVAAADAFYERQLELARALDDRRGIADALFNLAHSKFLITDGDMVVLDAIRDEAGSIYRELGDRLGLARLTWTSAYPLGMLGRTDEAREIVAAALVEFRQGGDDFYGALAAAALGGIAMMEGDIPEAVRLGLQSLQLHWAIGDVASITLTLRGAAAVWSMAGRFEVAATLFGAFEGHCRRYGVAPPMDPGRFMAFGGPTERLVAAFEEHGLEAARARGETLSTEAVLAYLFEEGDQLLAEAEAARS